MVGHCVNFLPLRMTMEGNPTFLEHLKNVRNMLLDAMDHVDYNFGRLIQKLNLPRRPTRAPLVSTMFNVDHIAEEFEMEGLELEMKPNPHCLSNFDFSLSLEDHAGRLEARCLYSSDMFEPATIERWLHYYQTLMQSVVADANCRIGKLGMLTAAERNFIVRCAGTEEHMIHDLLAPEVAAITQPGTPQLEMYVIDSHGELAPIGVIGELCIASLPPAAASGLAPERKVPSPFAEHYGAALYRTGSKARLLASGDMEIVGMTRTAETVKEGAKAAATPVVSRVESVLTKIWQDVLAQDAIGRKDDFFDLGGHSLLVTQIMLRVRQSFDVELTLRNFFDAPTIADLTELIEQRVVQQVRELPEAEAEQLTRGRLQGV
jgi:non-ribosomal peptide synthetase component F/acyl carrier protein